MPTRSGKFRDSTLSVGVRIDSMSITRTGSRRWYRPTSEDVLRVVRNLWDDDDEVLGNQIWTSHITLPVDISMSEELHVDRFGSWSSI